MIVVDYNGTEIEIGDTVMWSGDLYKVHDIDDWAGTVCINNSIGLSGFWVYSVGVDVVYEDPLKFKEILPI